MIAEVRKKPSDIKVQERFFSEKIRIRPIEPKAIPIKS